MTRLDQARLWRSLFARPVAMPLVVGILTLGIQVLYVAAADGGYGLLSPYPMSDANAYLYQAWAEAFIAPHFAYVSPLGLRSPYIYLLTWAYRVFGPGIWVPFGVNALALVIGTVTASLTGRQLFGAGAGWATGIVLALCGPLVFFTGLTVKTSLVVALTGLGIYLAVISLARPTWWLMGAGMCVLGLASLDRQNLLIFLPWLFLLFTWRAWRARAARAWVGAALLSGLVLLALANVAGWRPGAVEPRGFSPVGLNFYVGNAPDSWGGYTKTQGIHNDLRGQRTEAQGLAEAAVGHHLSRWGVSRYWISRSVGYWVQHPWGYVGLQARKLGLLFAQGAQGLPEQYAVWRWHRPALVIAIVDVGMMWALALSGMLFSWRESRDIRVIFLVGAVALYALSVWVFFVGARYRITLLILLAPFAGLTLARFVKASSFTRWRLGLGVAVLYAASLTLNSLLPYGPGWSRDPAATRIQEQSPQRAVMAMYQMQQAVVEHPTAAEWAALSDDVRERRDLADAALFARRAIALAPSRPLGYASLFRAQYAGHRWASLQVLQHRVAKLPIRNNAQRRGFDNLRRLIDQALLARFRRRS